jgi:hypothetical protein
MSDSTLLEKRLRDLAERMARECAGVVAPSYLIHRLIEAARYGAESVDPVVDNTYELGLRHGAETERERLARDVEGWSSGLVHDGEWRELDSMAADEVADAIRARGSKP